MMTRNEELERLLEDEAELDDDVENLNEVLKGLEEETPEWYEVLDELSAQENQLAYVRACLRDYEDEALS